MDKTIDENTKLTMSEWCSMVEPYRVDFVEINKLKDKVYEAEEKIDRLKLIIKIMPAVFIISGLLIYLFA